MTKSVRKYIAKNIRLIDKFYDKILYEEKKSTIRLGYVFFVSEFIPLKFKTKPDLLVKIMSIDYSKQFKDINDEDALKEGFNNKEELKSELVKFYPNITEQAQLTIINFVRVKNNNRL